MEKTIDSKMLSPNFCLNNSYHRIANLKDDVSNPRWPGDHTGRNPLTDYWVWGYSYFTDEHEFIDDLTQASKVCSEAGYHLVGSHHIESIMDYYIIQCLESGKAADWDDSFLACCMVPTKSCDNVIGNQGLSFGGTGSAHYLWAVYDICTFIDADHCDKDVTADSVESQTTEVAEERQIEKSATATFDDDIYNKVEIIKSILNDDDHSVMGHNGMSTESSDTPYITEIPENDTPYMPEIPERDTAYMPEIPENDTALKKYAIGVSSTTSTSTTESTTTTKDPNFKFVEQLKELLDSNGIDSSKAGIIIEALVGNEDQGRLLEAISDGGIDSGTADRSTTTDGYSTHPIQYSDNDMKSETPPSYTNRFTTEVYVAYPELEHKFMGRPRNLSMLYNANTTELPHPQYKNMPPVPISDSGDGEIGLSSFGDLAKYYQHLN